MANILIVEDNVLIREAVSDFARDAGHSVVAEVGSLKELDALDTTLLAQLDLAIFDINLEDGSSAAAVDAFYRDNVPIYIHSGYLPTTLAKSHFPNAVFFRKGIDLRKLQDALKGFGRT